MDQEFVAAVEAQHYDLQKSALGVAKRPLDTDATNNIRRAFGPKHEVATGTVRERAQPADVAARDIHKKTKFLPDDALWQRSRLSESAQSVRRPDLR